MPLAPLHVAAEHRTLARTLDQYDRARAGSTGITVDLYTVVIIVSAISLFNKWCGGVPLL